VGRGARAGWPIIGEQPVDYDAACDYLAVGDRPLLGANLSPSDASAEPATSRLSPRTSLIVVSGLSLAIWAAIWAALASLLSG
jgi:hypothetical protein